MCKKTNIQINMNISKSTHPLSKFIDTSSRTFYITKNKLEIKELEYKHKNKNTRHLTQVDFRKLREAQKKEKTPLMTGAMEQRGCV